MSKAKKVPKTVVIWSDYQTDPKFYLVEGDLRHLDGISINAGRLDDWQPLLEVTYGPEGDQPFMWSEFEVPIKELKRAIEQADHIISCGEIY